MTRKGNTRAVSRKKSARRSLAMAKANFALEAARAEKLLAGKRTHIVSARLTEALVAAAKERTGVTSDTDLIELALASLALEDDFGAWLIAQGGRLPGDFDVEL